MAIWLNRLFQSPHGPSLKCTMVAIEDCVKALAAVRRCEAVQDGDVYVHIELRVGPRFG